MAMPAAFSLKTWIDEHRHLLKPPVCNQVIWRDTEFMVMVVGGPNQRKDYHVNPTEEFFYQLEGEMVLKVIDGGEFRDIPIGEGEVFLLPPLVPHSPQRFAHTVGMVVEHKRPEGEDDHIRFYCECCREIIFDHSFYLTDLVTQLKPVMERFWGNASLRECSECGAVMEPPPAVPAR
ncbi:MAG: 3-hydroxyanthranilate 3,4-dioxygenase [Planctomycetota bacterium]